MKRFLPGTAFLLALMTCLSGCTAIGDKSASLTMIYGAAAVLSLLLMIAYCTFVRSRSVWFIVMFAAISVVNVGYFCLAVSSSLGEALLANRISYLGQVVLPMAMLMIILNITNTTVKKRLPYCLLTLAAVILFIAASPGFLDIYYKEVSFEIVNGVATLVKVYGPLHPLFLFYLVGYFAAMVAVIVRSWVKKTVDTTAHAVIVAISVFVNIGVWFIEQMVTIDFEMLSISYIISELFLLGVHLVMGENQRLKEQMRRQEASFLAKMTAQSSSEAAPAPAEVTEDVAKVFLRGYDMLTAKELELFKAYIAGTATKDILAAMDITENTLKYHSRNLYGKLGVTSRKQMVTIHRHLRAAGIIHSDL